MAWSIRTEINKLRFSVPFHIARPEESEAFRTVALELERDGARGIGECYPLAYYGETVETVQAVLPRLVGALDALGPLPRDRDAVLSDIENGYVTVEEAREVYGVG